MKIIVGLGNPGKKYQKTRHNLGFLVIENLHKFLKEKKREHQELAEITFGKIGAKKIILVKPHTFMNNSGQAVKFFVDKFKIPLGNLFIIQDDIDLPLGTMRISQARSAAGHKGILSIIKELGTKNFARFRIGIHPIGQTFSGRHHKKKTATEKFVLKKFTRAEQKIVRLVIKKTVQAILTAVKKDLTRAMNEFN